MRQAVAVSVCTLIFLCGSARFAVSQEQWSTAHVAPAGNLDVRLCYHGADGRVVAVGARQDRLEFETWEWDGASWFQRQPAMSPQIRQGCALVYDSARRVVVLFGGIDPFFGLPNDVWEWDGVTWVQRQPAVAPSGRYSMGMAFDVRRQRVVLYGGTDANAPLGDHWEWDGTSWSQQTLGATNPGLRNGAVMTYDTARGVVVMYGRHGWLGSLNEIWEYDGVRWRHPQPSLRPPEVRAPSMTFDSRSQRTVLYGGDVRGVPSTDLWEWDGTRWTNTVTPTSPGACLSAGLAYDERRDRVVLHGGKYATETWIWNRGTGSWTRAPYDVPRPVSSARVVSNLAGRTFYTTGFETFEWDHASLAWLRHPSTVHPSLYSVGALSFDVARRQAVLFGASLAGPAETWTWDERRRDWLQQSPVNSPPATHFGSIAYDVVRDRTVLFGGLVANLPSDKTWEWDGTNWVLQNPATSPPARHEAAMAYDFLTNRVVLFGGIDALFSRLGDVWDWDGTNWTQRSMGQPSPSGRSTMAMCSRSDGLLIVGGDDQAGAVFDKVWALRGNLWSQLPSAGMPALTPAQASVELGSDELTVFGGHTPSVGSPLQLLFTGGIWTYGIPRAAVVPIGGGCAGSNGIPDLVSLGLPVLGNAGYALESRDLVAAQPVAFVAGLSAGLVTLPNRCRMFVDSPIAATTTTSLANGTARLPLPVPNLLSLAGLELYLQSAALDRAGPGMTVTGALRIRLGL